jgi:hypothetical protein
MASRRDIFAGADAASLESSLTAAASCLAERTGAAE